MKVLLFLLLVGVVAGKVYFHEKFDDGEKTVGNNCSIILDELTLKLFRTFLGSWEKTWKTSEHDGKTFGKFEQTAGKFYGDENDKGEWSWFFKKVSKIQ